MNDNFCKPSRSTRRHFLAALMLGSATLANVRRSLASSGTKDPLLSALNLNYPGLAAVRKADATSQASARSTFAAYLRARTKPVWTLDPPLNKTLSGKDTVLANNALLHKFRVINIDYTFPGQIDWEFNPTTQPGYVGARNNEWTWQFNRHEWWPALARAYNTTGDQRYAKELVAEIRDWIAKNPPPAKMNNAPGSRWRTLEAGLRMQSQWPNVYFLMVKHPNVFPDDLLLAFVESIGQHANYLQSNHADGGNWLFTESAGLYTAGALFPEFAAAQTWRKTAIARLLERTTTDVYADGMEVELAPSYHVICINDLATVVNLAKLEGYNDVPASYLQVIEKMYDAMMWASSPARVVPGLNDSGPVDIRLLGTGIKLFPQRSDWRFFVEKNSAVPPPQTTSHLLPWAGWAVMRSGWDTQAGYLLFDAGPFGLVHQHEDKLSFVLNCYGTELVCEAGNYTYDASEMRKYVISARGHNVIHVDGREQHRRGQADRNIYVSKSPAALVWQTHADFDYASASYGREPIEFWGDDKRHNIVHTRQVLFVKPDIWIVLDTLNPNDDAEHLYESTFHLQSPSAIVDPTTKAVTTVRDRDANLKIFPLADRALSVKLISGQMKPFVQGWVPSVKNATDTGARPCVYFTKKVKGLTHFLYAFSPYPIGGQPKVVAVRSRSGDRSLQAEISLISGAKITVAVSSKGEMVVDGVGAKLLRLPQG